MTRNHDYETPSEGTTDWHVPLNANFERMDTDVELRDVESKLGDYVPKPGAKFLATDTENVFLGDGEQWNRLASAGRHPSFEAVDVTGGFTDPAGVTHSGELAEKSDLAWGRGRASIGYPRPNDGLAGVAEAVGSNRTVVLEPGGTYAGSETITVDPGQGDAVIDARGAILDYTGTGVCVDVLENATDGAAGRVRWVGGEFRGPGQGTGTAFRVTDSSAHDLSPDRVGVGKDNGWQRAFYLRVVDHRTEANAIHDVLGIENCDRWVLFHGPSDTDGDGAGSFRFTRVENLVGDVDGTPAIETTADTNPYNSTFAHLTGSVNVQDGRLLHVAGGWASSEIYDLFAEAGDANSGCVMDFGPVSRTPMAIHSIEGGGSIDGVDGAVAGQRGIELRGSLAADGWSLRNVGDQRLTIGGDGDAATFDGNSGVFEFRQDGSTTTALRPDQTVIPERDLTGVDPESGAIAKHDGSGSPSESLCFEQAGSWYNVVDGSTF
ncbi:hypothetical protein HUG10_11190 [Halorarum halophilum]|uniref:Uncharacterized protein n=1 Tax=Halorarum halophilum TaxID=2743090 RepID=A0A7D5L2T8_9EURY|nr:hypothetical protein [Halobaculum halophilum]QLG28083.1 hypothetical protein HUG10_11190 [Halobaculum halophilum]